jgi:hypothetical protein
MSKNELVDTSASVPVDSISGHTDETVSAESKKSSRLFRGERIKFSKTSEWETKSGEPIPRETRLLLVDVTRVVTRWSRDKPPQALETVELSPGELWPDIAAWNDALPHTEWVQGFNGLEGPWKPQQILTFMNPRSMAPFHWIDSTTGGRIAISEAVDSIYAASPPWCGTHRGARHQIHEYEVRGA